MTLLIEVEGKSAFSQRTDGTDRRVVVGDKVLWGIPLKWPLNEDYDDQPMKFWIPYV